MKSRSATLTAFMAFAFFIAPAFGHGHPAGYIHPGQNPPSPPVENNCLPVTNIKVEMLAGGKALMSWDAVPGVPKYSVKLVDENQNVLLDTVTNTNKVMASGLDIGVKYKFSVCYICEKTGKLVCAYKDFRYIIIEDQVVMFDGGGACTCGKTDGTEGVCNSSQSPYFTLESGKVYNVHLMDNTTITFICNSTVNPVGNCPINFGGMGMAVHGDYGSLLPFYEVGSSKIFFHGSTFCVQGEDVESVNYCDISSDKEQENDTDHAGKVYPNPFSDRILVETGEPVAGEETTIRMFNAAGCLVMEETARISGFIALNTSHLPPGLYWMRIESAGRAPVTERLLKSE